MLSRTFICFLLLLFASCITISINENGYRQLKDADKATLRQYPATYDPSRPASLVEITGTDIVNDLDKHAYTWVHLWIPYCKGPNCMPLFFYDKIANDHAKDDVELYMVSQFYGQESVNRALSRSSFSHNIYVLKDAHYGHKQRKAMLAFTNELLADSMARRAMPSHILFKGPKLVWYSYSVSNGIVDSVGLTKTGVKYKSQH